MSQVSGAACVAYRPASTLAEDKLRNVILCTVFTIRRGFVHVTLPKVKSFCLPSKMQAESVNNPFKEFS